MKVLKFGGTSVGSIIAIQNVLKIIKNNLSNNELPIVICSAMSGVTNKLNLAATYATQQNENYLKILKEIENTHLEIIYQLISIKRQSDIIIHIKVLLNKLEDLLHGVFLLQELSNKSQALILSFGEQISCHIITELLKQHKINARYIDARTLIKTDNNYTSAIVNFEATNRLVKKFIKNLDYIPIITGFIASTIDNETTTLGRGGSDYTASIIGAGIKAQLIEIWTDVDGVMTADPRQVKTATTIPYLTYKEAMELSHFGAKIIYSPTLYPLYKQKIPLVIKNTFNPTHQGTLVEDKSHLSDSVIKGISSINNVAILNIEGSNMVGIPGILGRVAKALANNKINVILVTQASSEHSICIVVTQENSHLAESTLNEVFNDEIRVGKIDKIKALSGFSCCSIVGNGMRSYSGMAGRFFATLGKHGININAIAQGSSELNISAVISTNMLNKALNVVHEAFFSHNVITLNLFFIGVGLIGSTLITQIKSNADYLEQEKRIKIRIIGLANSKKMLFAETGIDMIKWQQILKTSTKINLSTYVSTMKQLNLANSVFIDCTSSRDIVALYEKILSASIAISTPNKIANSVSYDEYKHLRNLANKHNTKFLYETNVGAGLPIINTLQNIKLSGDKILRIEGVLSGTMSYIFNNFKGKTTFSAIVKKAKEQGYTEPDPRDDLNGTDVARKILILAREDGTPLELKDVTYKNILPSECQKAKSVEEFFISLEQNNHIFEELKQSATKQNKVLRFIATYEHTAVSIALKMVDKNHPFYNLSGSDNIVSFTTLRYKDRPLVIQGPGAGAAVTASGLFAEIISIANYLKG